MSDPAISGSGIIPIATGPLVLVVDDTPINRAVACILLNQIGCRAVAVDSGAAALEAVASQPIDLVLMDCQMPGMDGFEAASRIRQTIAPGRRLPIIAVTGFDQPADRERSRAVGMDDHLVKPLQIALLRQSISRWADGGVSVPPTPSAADAGNAILDSAPLQAFDRLRPGSGAVLLGIYQKDLTVVMESLARAVADGDLNAVARLTHKLKGASLTVGARALATAMKELGQLARDGSLSACQELWRQAEVVLAGTRAAIVAYCSGEQPGAIAATQPPWPAGRVSSSVLAEQRAKVERAEGLSVCLEAMPAMAMLLNPERQIVAANGRLLRTLKVGDQSELIGKRPGEALGCTNALDGPDGCGTATACAFCGAVQAVVTGFRDRVQTVKEARLTIGRETGHALDLEMTATPIRIGDSDFVILAARDIADEKRRQVLERLFFHDVLNSAGGIQGLVTLLEKHPIGPTDEDTLRRLLAQTTQHLIDEIQYHRLLTSAETGDLRTDLRTEDPAALLREVRDAFASHQVAEQRSLVLGALSAAPVRTDRVLFRRVLGNLVKNALEATPPGGLVTIGCRVVADEVHCSVHNPGVMPPEVQHQLFRRSFTTKGNGRGLGTWSAKLFGERYLAGRLSFTSVAGTGTEMMFSLPVAAT